MAHELDLVTLIESFGDEEKCREFLENLRWPDGVICPRCGWKSISRVHKRGQFDCNSCRYQFSVGAGTIFNDSHLPLLKWFIATYLLCQSRKGMSANQISRTLGISYKTSWFLCHRIRKAMEEGLQSALSGTVEVDETYVGGKRKGTGVWHGRQNKEIVVGIRQRGGDLRFFHVGRANVKTIRNIIEQNVSGDVDVIVTDELGIYPYATKPSFAGKHRTIRHKSRVYVDGDIHTNTVENAFSLLKRGIIGSWHRLSAKHLPAYLDEMCWRFNNRKNPFLFRDTLLRLLNAPVMEYKKLTAA